MQVSTITKPGVDSGADTVAVGVFKDEEPPSSAPAQVGELLGSGEARTSLKALALTHVEGTRWLIVGLGERGEFTPESARAVGATMHARALEISTRTLCLQAPDGLEAPAIAGLAEGAILADYRYEEHKSDRGAGGDSDAPPRQLESLIISAPGQELATVVAEAALVADAVNAARDLQNRPGNDLTPTALARHALALAKQIESLSVEAEGRARIAGLGMGAFAAVAQGSDEEPALITMRYEPPGGAHEGSPTLGFVGKAVTFDSGGISLKPGAKMAEMKFDMSGGAAVIEAVAAIARLGLGVEVIAVIGATENLPSGHSVKPGDIVSAANGKTIEVNNTDAEGRLVLADCLVHAVNQGAERIVDLATLTGAVIVALGSTYAGLMSNDDELAAHIEAAGERTGEIVWRLPLHEEYDELIKGTYADLDNAPEARKAGTIIGGAFLQNFVADTPWAHLDIAGSAWDLARPYAPKGAAGYGVRLLVELARSYCA